MIFFLMTSKISFAPLSSRKESRSRTEKERDSGIPSRPSAKSMFRLADKVRNFVRCRISIFMFPTEQLGLNDLMQLSKKHISSQLTIENIVEELFSGFTSR